MQHSATPAWCTVSAVAAEMGPSVPGDVLVYKCIRPGSLQSCRVFTRQFVHILAWCCWLTPEPAVDASIALIYQRF
jgi:hypothetical protein